MAVTINSKTLTNVEDLTYSFPSGKWNNTLAIYIKDYTAGVNPADNLKIKYTSASGVYNEGTALDVDPTRYNVYDGTGEIETEVSFSANPSVIIVDLPNGITDIRGTIAFYNDATLLDPSTDDIGEINIEVK